MDVASQSEKFCCPRCGSSEISKSRQRGAFEHYLDNKWQIRPYRCYECTLRFWKRRGPLAAQKHHWQMGSLQPFFHQVREKFFVLSSRFRHLPEPPHRKKKAA